MNDSRTAMHKNGPTEGGPSYSLSHRFFRAIWALSWLFLASWTPVPLHPWRVFVVRLFGANVHRTAHIYNSVKIWYPPNLTMGQHSCLGPYVNCYNMATINLGEGAIVSQGAHLCAGTHDIDDLSHKLITKPILIGKGAWIAADAFVGPGVTVGENAVVGARAVIFKDAKPFGVYIGNPAKWLRARSNI